jgi:transposase-like protein
MTNSFSTKRQEAWRLYVEAGMPIKAIAETLGVSVSAVKTWLYRDRRRGVQPASATDEASATATDSATETGASATDEAVTAPATATNEAATDQAVLTPPPLDSWGRPYISLIATFGRHGACPVCHKYWPSPLWSSNDSMRRLVVFDLGGAGEPHDRLMIQLICKACADAGPRGSLRFDQVITAWRSGSCVDCNRNPRDLGPDEFVKCNDNRTRCLKHAVRWWQYSGQLDQSDRPCIGCGKTDDLYACEDGQVRCKACRLRAWREDRQPSDAPGRGIPFGL